MQGRDAKVSEASGKIMAVFASNNTQHLGTHWEPHSFLNQQSKSRPE